MPATTLPLSLLTRFHVGSMRRSISGCSDQLSLPTALARRRAEVTVQPAALYVDYGDVLTSAGTASAIDACLHIVRSQLGSAAAATVARNLVVAPHRDGDQAHLDHELTVDDLAAHARMSRRNCTRRFAAATGTTAS